MNRPAQLTTLPDGTTFYDGKPFAKVRQTEIDFGAVPIPEKSSVITDAAVSASSHLIGNVAYEAPTGKSLDELEMDALDLKFAPGSGQFTLYARGMDGYV